MEKGNLQIIYQTPLGSLLYDFFRGVKKSNIEKVLSKRHNIKSYKFVIPRKNKY